LRRVKEKAHYPSNDLMWLKKSGLKSGLNNAKCLVAAFVLRTLAV
jgi:hypothetical protein